MSERSGRSDASARPGWGGLYAVAGLMLAALGVAEIFITPGAELAVLQCATVVAGFGAMVGWTRRHRAAFDRMDWCDCAGARVTMRVIPSRRRDHARTVTANAQELVEESVEAGAELEGVAR